jgi:hypothetical protein
LASIQERENSFGGTISPIIDSKKVTDENTRHN